MECEFRDKWYPASLRIFKLNTADKVFIWLRIRPICYRWEDRLLLRLSLHIYEDLLYIYNLYDNTWINQTRLVKESNLLVDNSQCIYDDVLYFIMDWDDKTGRQSRKIYSINLSNYSYEFEEVSISNEGSKEWLFWYDSRVIWCIYSEEDHIMTDISIISLY